MDEKTGKLIIDQGVKLMFGDKPVGFAKSGMLTYQEEDDGATKDGGAWENPIRHTYEVKCDKGVVRDTLDRELLYGTPSKVDVEIRCEMGKMPRKMKKAYRTGSRYRRDTKWKRKAKTYDRRFIYRLPNAGMVVTRKQREMLEVIIRGSELQYNPVAYVSEKDISKALAAYVKRCWQNFHSL